MEEFVARGGLKWTDRLLVIVTWAVSAAVLGAVLWKSELSRQIIPALAAGPLAGFFSCTISEFSVSWLAVAGHWRQVLGASFATFFFLGIFVLSRPIFMEVPDGIPFIDVLGVAGVILAESLVLAIATTTALRLSTKLLSGAGGARIFLRMVSGAAGCAMIPWALGMTAGEPGNIWVFLTAYLGLNLAIAEELAAADPFSRE
jgi:hypothetical protein